MHQYVKDFNSSRQEIYKKKIEDYHVDIEKFRVDFEFMLILLS